MARKFKCPKCGRRSILHESEASGTVTCSCGARLKIPAASPAAVRTAVPPMPAEPVPVQPPQPEAEFGGPEALALRSEAVAACNENRYPEAIQFMRRALKVGGRMPRLTQELSQILTISAVAAANASSKQAKPPTRSTLRRARKLLTEAAALDKDNAPALQNLQAVDSILNQLQVVLHFRILTWARGAAIIMALALLCLKGIGIWYTVPYAGTLLQTSLPSWLGWALGGGMLVLVPVLSMWRRRVIEPVITAYRLEQEREQRQRVSSQNYMNIRTDAPRVSGSSLGSQQ